MLPVDDPNSFHSMLGRPLMSANHFKIDTSRPYVVKNLLLARQVSMLCGAPNTGKSAVLACISSHVAMGRDFAEHRVRRAAVVYVAAEDPNGIGERTYPYMSAAPQSTAPFYILDRSLNLRQPDEVSRFITELLELSAKAGIDNLLVILDTLNLCIGDGDENSARDMGQAIGSAQRIAQATGAHVLIAHHTGTQDKSRPRGSSAMNGNIDTMLVLHKADDSQPKGVVYITQEKQRNAKKGAPIAFQIVAFDAGLDSEGDEITVPMAVPYEPRSSLAPASSGRSKDRTAGSSGERAADLKRVFEELAGIDGTAWHEAKSLGMRTGVPFNDVRDNADSLRVAVKRAIDALLKGKVIESAPDGKGYRLARPDTPAEEPPAATLH